MNAKITQLKLPNGNLMTIEGADADQVAAIVSEKTAAQSTTNEAALGLPVLNFGQAEAIENAEQGESVLAIPSTH